MVSNYGAYAGNGRMPTPTTPTPMGTVPQPQQPQPVAPTPNYADWIAQNAMAQPAPRTEQRGITAVYTVHSRAEYDSIVPIACQTIAIFNFHDHEVCLKAMDAWGIDLGVRFFELKETTPPVAQTQQNQNDQPPATTDGVSKADFDELSQKINAIYNELKG